MKNKLNRILKISLSFLIIVSLFSTENIGISAIDENEISNIALNKEVSASKTDYGRGPENAVDGNMDVNSFWDGGNFGNYMTVDLGGTYDLNEIKVFTYWDNNRYYHYKLLASSDGINFEVISQKTNDTISSSEGDTHTVNNVVANFVRIQIDYNSSPWGGIQLCELEVYGKKHIRTEDDNIAYKKKVVDTTTHTYTDKLTDGNEGSFINVNDFAEYIIDLESIYSINEIEINSESVLAGYIIKGSKDGVYYKELNHGVLSNGNQEISLKGYRIRYFKISFQGTARINETRLYGIKSSLISPDENIAKGKVITASATANGMLASNAIDGNLNSYWDGGTTGQYVTLDLKDYYSLNKINVVTYFADERYYKYVVSTSKDGEAYKPIYTKYDEGLSTQDGNTHEFNNEIARYIRITILENSAQWGSVHLNELEVYGTEIDYEDSNIALGKKITATSSKEGFEIQNAIDENYLSAWKATTNTDQLFIDFQEAHKLEKLFIISDENTSFKYQIYASRDNNYFDLIASGTALSNEKIDLKGSIFQYLKLIVSDIDGNIIPIYELKVNGLEICEAEDGDIAYLKPVRSNVSQAFSSVVCDQNEDTVWLSRYYPTYLDIDLMYNYNVNKIKVQMKNITGYYRFAVYASKDGNRFDKVFQKTDNSKPDDKGYMEYDLDGANDVRIIRVQFEYNSSIPNIDVAQIRLYGEKSNTDIEVSDELTYTAFHNTDFAKEITDEDVISYIEQLIIRNFGEEYVDWFKFVLKDKDAEKDYFEIKNDENKIQITGNEGLSLTTGLYHYLKYYCNVQLSEMDSQVNMPDRIVFVNEVIKKETPYEVRYAYNYCTLSYTLAFYGVEDWQRELDWLALNGVNVILDLNGQEAVWHNFLKKIGYTDEEAKDWLAGPGYYAWQFMSNMETFNGPVSNTWIVERLNLARKNQFNMRILGMEPVYQAYSGEIPVNIKEKDANIDVVPQGFWMRFDRPSMIRTTSESYQKYSELFYESQKEVLGDNTHYYATDPFHEGGLKGDMDEADIGKIIYHKLHEIYPDSTWIIQSWSLNAKTISKLTNEEKQNGLLVLDLEADKFPRYAEIKETTFSEVEFNGTPWVFCILDNFGGRQGVQAELDLIANIKEDVYDKTKYMKGIGLSSEGTWTNPIQYELLYESAWVDKNIDVDEWIDKYVERRYGASNESAQKAWDVFRNTAYKYPKEGHTGNPESIINATPRFNIAYVAPQGSVNIPYDSVEFEKGVELLFEGFEELKNIEGYQFDATDMLRQYLSNTALDYYRKFTTAYEKKDIVAFEYFSEKFLDLIILQDKVLSTNKEFLVGTWIQRAKDIGNEYNEDDFQKDMLERNARALITTWGSYEMSSLIFSHDGIHYSGGSLQDYANRQYAGLTKDYYLVRWQKWISSLKETITEDDYNDYTFNEGFELGWNWSLNKNEYSTIANNNLKDLATEVFANYGLNDDYKLDLEIINGDKINTKSLYLHRGITSEIIVEMNENEYISSTSVSTSEKDIEYDVVGQKIVVKDITNNILMKIMISEKSVDKGALEAVIEKAEKIDINKYTTDTADRLTKAMAEAKKVNDNVDATEKEVADAVALVETAISELVERADKSTLADQIARVEAMDTSIYTSESVAVLTVAIAEAKKVNDNEDAVAKDVEEAINKIEKAIEVLEIRQEVINKQQLLENVNKMKEQVAEMSSEDYTAETWNALMEAITNAETVVENNEASAEEITQAIEMINKAYASLEKVTTTEPVEPIEPEKPDTEDKDTSSNGTNTGDTTNTEALILMLLVAGTIIGSIKYQNQKKVSKINWEK